MKKKLCALIISGGFLLLCSGCSNQHSNSSSDSSQDQQLGDAQILNILMTVDKGEIAASQVALKKQLSAPINAYAKLLIQQHERNLQELTLLSKNLELDPKDSAISKSLDASGKKDLKAMDEMQGRAFELSYIDIMIKEHQEGLELIDTKLLPQTKNPELRIYVEQFRKMVADHLQKGRNVQMLLKNA